MPIICPPIFKFAQMTSDKVKLDVAVPIQVPRLGGKLTAPCQQVAGVLTFTFKSRIQSPPSHGEAFLDRAVFDD